jgi:predicted permease
MATLENIWQDVRYALRGIRRAPAFAATVIATLGLGIGANAAMFGVVDRLMFRPLSYLKDPGSVRRIYWQFDNRGATRTTQTTYYTRYLDLTRWTHSFSQLAAFSERNLAIGDGALARERRVGTVSASFFEFFDARPALGRFFIADEDVTPRGADVAVLSYPFWKSEFGGRDVRGEVLRVGDTRATIIGVAPRGFDGVNDANPPVVYIPITTYAASGGNDDAKRYYTHYEWGWVNVMVRLAPGVSVDAAEADATQAFRRSYLASAALDPTSPPIESARPHVAVSAVRPGAGPEPALEARTALWVSVVAAIVLVIATANVANLFLARALRRRRETVVRLALGVSRSRLVLQAMTESIVLSLLGAAAALVIAQWAGVAIRTLLVTTPDPSSFVFTDPRTVGLTIVLAAAAGTLVGFVTAISAGRRDLSQALRGGVRGGVTERARLRAGLLITQAALSVALLIGAAVFVRSLGAVKSMRIGYDADRVLLVSRIIQRDALNDSTQRLLRSRLLDAARALPDVESAAWVSSAPFVSTSSTRLYVAGIDSVDALGSFSYQATTADYFRTMGTRMLRGRPILAEDRAGAPNVAVVSESMARTLWPGQDALGKCFRMREATAPCMTVVGIAEDMVQRDLAGTQRLHYYVSIDQYTRTWGNGLVLRVRGHPAAKAERIRKSLQALMPGTSYVIAQPLSDIVADAQRSWRLGATMFVAFGFLALVVAAVGLYGVVGYDVAQRTHELGVRVALGAQRADVIGMVVTQGARFAVAGAVAGVGLALLSARWLQPLLFRQSATDPWVFGGVSAAMIVVALGASLIPAIRASRVDPITALRTE